MSVKKNRIYLTDSHLIKALIQILLFKNVKLLTESNLKNIFKENNYEIKLFIAKDIDALKIFSRKFFSDKIFSINVYTSKKINLQIFREIFHEAGFSEIESRHFNGKSFLSTSLPLSKYKFIINGFLPGNPLFSKHINPLKIYKYASDKIVNYPWFSHGQCCGLDENYQLISQGNHFHRTSVKKKLENYRQVVTIYFYLSKKKSTFFSIRFNLCKKTINTFYECIFLKKENKITFIFTNIIEGKLDKEISRFELNDFPDGLNSARIIFDKNRKELILFYAKYIIEIFSLQKPKYGNYLHFIKVDEFRSYNYSIELKKNYFNKIKSISSELVP